MEVSSQIRAPATLPQGTDRSTKRGSAKFGRYGHLGGETISWPCWDSIADLFSSQHGPYSNYAAPDRTLSLRRRALKCRSQGTKTQTNITNNWLRYKRR